MPENKKCPKCRSENLMYSRKRILFICEDCSNEFTFKDKSHLPLRIFLSYGHDQNEELVRLIKSDLEKRGHDVWFDKSEVKELGIKPGDDWRRAITDGIVNSNCVVSFLSKHSTRDPGVCLDEISIALGVKGGNIQTILVESEREVKAPPSISYIQWLDMHEWKEKKLEPAVIWEHWYNEKLGEIIEVIESDESRRFAGEIEILAGYLKPISCDSRISQLLQKGFIGRQWVLDSIEQWRTRSDNSSRLFWILGNPGMGKSAIMAHLSHFGKDRVIAAQFCEYDKPDHRNTERIICNLAFQISTRFPDYRKLLLNLPEINKLETKGESELFDYLIANPLKQAIKGGRDRYLILIDALDEAKEGESNPLVEMLARHAPLLPDWLGILATSRPEKNVSNPLQGLNPFILDTDSESNKEDIRQYLKYELKENLTKIVDPESIVEHIVRKSEGVFLYIEQFCVDVIKGNISLDTPHKFPQGLGENFYHWFQRQFPDYEKYEKTIAPILSVVLSARESLPIKILQNIFNWQVTDLRKHTRLLGSMFTIKTESEIEIIKPFHKSIADWLADENKSGIYLINLDEGQEKLAEFGWNEVRKNLYQMTRYMRINLPAHLINSGRLSDFCNLIISTQYPDLLRTFGEIPTLLSFCYEQIKTFSLFSPSQKEIIKKWLNNSIENKIGQLLHEDWFNGMRESGNPAYLWPDWRDRLQPWPLLNRTHREKWWREVNEVYNNFRQIGLGIRLPFGKVPKIFILTKEELELFAQSDFERWSREAKSIGWTYAPQKNIEKLHHPYLKDWSDIPEDIKAYNRYSFTKYQKVILLGGYELYRLEKI